MIEATAICPEVRISPDDSGIWSDTHAELLYRSPDSYEIRLPRPRASSRRN